MIPLIAVLTNCTNIRPRNKITSSSVRAPYSVPQLNRRLRMVPVSVVLPLDERSGDWSLLATHIVSKKLADLVTRHPSHYTSHCTFLHLKLTGRGKMYARLHHWHLNHGFYSIPFGYIEIDRITSTSHIVMSADMSSDDTVIVTNSHIHLNHKAITALTNIAPLSLWRFKPPNSSSWISPTNADVITKIQFTYLNGSVIPSAVKGISPVYSSAICVKR